MRKPGAAVSRRELTTVLTTTMTTVGLPDTSTYRTIELVPCLVAESACAYGSEGQGFESFGRALRARSVLSTSGTLWVAKLIAWRGRLSAPPT